MAPRGHHREDAGKWVCTATVPSLGVHGYPFQSSPMLTEREAQHDALNDKCDRVRAAGLCRLEACYQLR